MPGDSGRATLTMNNGSACQSNVAGTPATNNGSLPNDQNLVAELTATLSPVKTANEAKAYLKQRSLSAIDNNYGMITLVNLLITTSLEAKIPDHAANVMRAVAFLMMKESQNIFIEDLAVAIVEKVNWVSEHLNVQMDCKWTFLEASATMQANHTQQLSDLVTSLMKTPQDITSSSQIISKSAENITKSATNILPFTQTISTTANHVTLVTESAKALVKVVDDLKFNPPVPNPTQQHTQGTTSSYAKAVANGIKPPTLSPYTPYTPEYVTWIENRLHIQEHQVYITFDNNALT